MRSSSISSKMIMRNDVLLEIATFLTRRWSGNTKATIVLTQDKIPTAKPEKSQIALPFLNYYLGTDFQKYRQWRVALWYESMRILHSTKVLSYDHAFGFLLNTVETKRIELLGLSQWNGMRNEIIFNEGMSWLSRPLLNSIYGRYKIAEAFSQYFLTGYMKGELYGGEFERVKKASDFANNIVIEAIDNNYKTESIEQHIPQLIKILDLDETSIYDADLIQKIKASFRDWKTGWIEQHQEKGEEFDPESYTENLPKTFLTDYKLSIKTKVVILLDHSSSIEDVELEYKRATIALCEALHYLGIKFAVYAFSTDQRRFKCWVIKPTNLKWTVVSARRLVQIKASGGTPLAEIYGLLQPIMKSFKPDIMVTLTDGEPSDFHAVREMVLLYRKMGIHMVSLGLGRNVGDSVSIGHNLVHLNYERILSVSRLEDIPKKVINLLRA